MTDDERLHRTVLQWKNYMDDITENGVRLSSLEEELYHDYAMIAEIDAEHIALLEHERGLLREALKGNIRELEALALSNRKLLTLAPLSAKANGEDDRCDSDPPKKS